MNIALTPEMERFIEERVKSGPYPTTGDVIGEAPRFLENAITRATNFVLTCKAGLDQLTRREGRTYDRASGRQLAERIKARGRSALPTHSETASTAAPPLLNSTLAPMVLRSSQLKRLGVRKRQ